MINGLAHIGIKTMDSEKSVDFYKNTLGFQHYYHYNTENGVTLDFLRLGGCVIELICSPGVTEETLDKEGTVAHVALDVLNIDEMVSELKLKGIDTWQSDEVNTMDGLFPAGIKNIFFKGPSGELIELMEYTSIS